MNATILPSDEMIHVLSDAIASKRATIDLMARAQKEATEDLARLRRARAVHLARAAGIEIGQVWVIHTPRYTNKPAIVTSIDFAHNSDDAADWGATVMLDERYSNGQWATDTIQSWRRGEFRGRIEPGCWLHERMTKLAAEVAAEKEKAA